MRPDEQTSGEDKKTARRRMNLELYYYERVGDRMYFRITPFAIILMLFAALAGITIIIIDYRRNPPRQTNVNITVPQATSDSLNSRTLRPVPSSKANNRPATSSPSPVSSNMNTGNGTPQPKPISESPPGK